MRYTHRMLQAVLPLALASVLASALVSCTYERVVHDDMNAWRSIASKPKADADPTTPDFTSQSSGGWAIELATFTGKHRKASALRLVTWLKENTTLTDAWIYDQENDTLVMQGRFTEPNSPQVQEELHHIRAMKIQDVQRFEKVQIVPYGKTAMTAATPSDLAQFTGIQGYTLQVAFFDKAGGSRFREAAETYCRQLREKNEQAYFYHGPNRSMVTIGLFTDADWEGEGIKKHYGQRIQDLQLRFPNNLGNGSTIVEKVNGQIIGDQSSVLVHLPR